MSRLSLVILGCVVLAGCLDGPQLSPREWIHEPEARLRASPLPDLLVEIDYVEGYAPAPLALQALRETLEQVTDKRTITILEPSEIPRRSGLETGASLRQLHWDTFDHAGEDGIRWGQNGTLHILYVNGASEDDEFQGIYAGAAVLLPDYWRGYFGVASIGNAPEAAESPLQDRFERAVLIHEVGHALGLVNLGVPALVDRMSDDECACHSTNPQSAMYVGNHDAIRDPVTYLQERGFEPVYKFDAADLEDLAAYRDGRTGPKVR